jgi:hypothetical protein
MMQSYKKYLKRLDAALAAFMKGDSTPFEELRKEYFIAMPVNPAAYEAGVLKLVVNRPLPQELKVKATKRLAELGFSGRIFGDE